MTKELFVTTAEAMPDPAGLQEPAALPELAVLAGQRAEELYRSKRYMCTEAILVALNEALDGGLTEDTAAALAAAFPDGMGGSGCLCGAVSGGAMALGLLLAPTHSRKDIRGLSAELHAAFRARHKSVCCRVLTKDVRADKKAHFAQCAGLTGEAAAMAADMILARRPDLAGRAPGSPAAGRAGSFRRLLGPLKGLRLRRLRHFLPLKLFGLQP